MNLKKGRDFCLLPTYFLITFTLSSDKHGSKFTIKDDDFENSYCNIKRPPSYISSSSDTLIVRFYKAIDPHIMYTEGFRASYDTSTVSVDEDIDYQTPRSKGL